MTDEPICKVDEYGTKFWYLNGKLHRTDGPAVEHANGEKCWYLNGKEISKEEHRSITALYNWIKENDR